MKARTLIAAAALTVGLGIGGANAVIENWSTTASNNTDANISPEGMSGTDAPSTIDNSYREALAQVRRWGEQIVHNMYSATTGASSPNAMRITPAIAPATLTQGSIYAFKAPTTNTGAATLEVNTLGALTMFKQNDQDLEAGDIEENQAVVVMYDGVNFQVVSSSALDSDVVSDTTPQLGGDLDVNGNSIVSASNGNIVIAPDGTGDVRVSGTTDQAARIELYEDADNGTNFTALAATDSVSSDVTWTLPAEDGSFGDALVTNGNGNLSFKDVAGLVRQVLQSNHTSVDSTQDLTFRAITDMSQAITLGDEGNSVLIIATVHTSGDSATGPHLKLTRGGTDIGIGDAAGSRERVSGVGGSGTSTHEVSEHTLIHLDSPGSVGPHTYDVRWNRPQGSGTMFTNRSRADTDAVSHGRTASSITLIEIGS